jgi:hypothetical protein
MHDHYIRLEVPDGHVVKCGDDIGEQFEEGLIVGKRGLGPSAGPAASSLVVLTTWLRVVTAGTLGVVDEQHVVVRAVAHKMAGSRRRPLVPVDSQAFRVTPQKQVVSIAAGETQRLNGYPRDVGFQVAPIPCHEVPIYHAVAM